MPSREPCWRIRPPDDNAHRKGARLTVRYQHHPRHGESVVLVRRGTSASSTLLVCRLPDGSPLTLQDWMTRPEAELFPTVLRPRIAPRALVHVHDIVSDFLLSVDGAEGGNDGTGGSPEGAVRPGGGEPGRTVEGGEAGAAGAAGRGDDQAGGNRPEALREGGAG